MVYLKPLWHSAMTQNKCIFPHQVFMFFMSVTTNYFAKQHKVVGFCEVEAFYRV